MRYICALLEGIIVTAVCYCTIYIMCKKERLAIPYKGYWIQSKFVWAISVVTFLASGVIGYVRLFEMSVPLHLLSLILIVGMAILSVTDHVRHWVPNRILLCLLMIWCMAVGITVIFDTQLGMELLGRGLIGGFVSGLIFLLCYILSKKQLGAGDVKLAFIMGLFMTGQRIMGGIVYGTLLCFLYSVIQLLRKKLTMKDQVPLVPFLYGGVLITYFIL